MLPKGTTYLGIDGGGSRCRARIEDGNGRLLGEGISGPATTRIGVEKAWRSIMEAYGAWKWIRWMEMDQVHGY